MIAGPVVVGAAADKRPLIGRLIGSGSSSGTDEDLTSGMGEVLVVGAGVTGLCCAYQLARRGWNVQLLEQVSSCAPEAL